MGRDHSELSAAGWTLAIGACSAGTDADTRDFHAIYRGEDFGSSSRGIVAAVARGATPSRSGTEAAQIAVHSLAEGYFGATPTLGAGRAASLALASVNGWMYSQALADPERTNMAAAVSALIFVGRHVRLIHVGDCRIYRRRGKDLAPLTTEHVRPLADGTLQLSRAVGGDAELHADYLEDASELGDRYVIVSPGSYRVTPPGRMSTLLSGELPPEAVAQAIVDAASSSRATAVVIEILAKPAASFDELAASFAQLPLRGPPRDGENWDGFVLGRTLYRSRYTTLKLARDTVEDREVVLKIPLPAMLQDHIFRAGFLREAWVGTTVHSRRIARYLEVPPERRSSLYLVMPYYRGQTLEERLSQPPPISCIDGIGIALELCEAVRDLASYQIIHRDLKPENVMILGDGEIRLLDLGLAYLPGLDEPDDDRLGGTTRYTAPELFRGTPAGERSEVFSLGVTIYRMFAGGAFPFGQRESVPLARLRRDLPSWLGICLARAIAMEPEQRYASVAELAAALESGLAGDGTARAPSWRDTVGTRIFWRRVAMIFAAVITILLVLLHRAPPAK